MSDGEFVRLNASLVNNTSKGEGVIISVIGKMEATDGSTLSLRTSDDAILQYNIQPEFDFVQVNSQFMHTREKEMECFFLQCDCWR